MATHSGALTWRIPMDRGAWWATAHEVAESDTPEQLNTQLLYNIVMVFAKHQHQPQVYVRLPQPEPPSHLAPHPICQAKSMGGCLGFILL